MRWKKYNLAVKHLTQWFTRTSAVVKITNSPWTISTDGSHVAMRWKNSKNYTLAVKRLKRWFTRASAVETITTGAISGKALQPIFSFRFRFDAAWIQKYFSIVGQTSEFRLRASLRKFQQWTFWPTEIGRCFCPCTRRRRIDSKIFGFSKWTYNNFQKCLPRYFRRQSSCTAHCS